MKINREGYRIIIITTLLFALGETALIIWTPSWLAWIVGFILLGLLAFVLRFFRDPQRETLTDPDIVYAPADGEIVVSEVVTDDEYFKGKCIQVSVFMSIWNVHANWFPVAGKVVYFRHHHGKYLVAWHPKSSEENERTTTVVDTGKHKVLFRQIAGYVARRIVSYAVE
ncbi:MAG: phosphatidylserine decarboxylase, partial [Rikenellaceae bacterium]|nr:phosphatidylserine decarboxylase [Rikenellaceae bacterium]